MHVCEHCGSEDVTTNPWSKISEQHCNDCGHDWEPNESALDPLEYELEVDDFGDNYRPLNFG